MQKINIVPRTAAPLLDRVHLHQALHLLRVRALRHHQAAKVESHLIAIEVVAAVVIIRKFVMLFVLFSHQISLC